MATMKLSFSSLSGIVSVRKIVSRIVAFVTCRGQGGSTVFNEGVRFGRYEAPVGKRPHCLDLGEVVFKLKNQDLLSKNPSHAVWKTVEERHTGFHCLKLPRTPKCLRDCAFVSTYKKHTILLLWLYTFWWILVHGVYLEILFQCKEYRRLAILHIPVCGLGVEKLRFSLGTRKSVAKHS